MWVGRNVFHWNYGIHVITVKTAVFIHIRFLLVKKHQSYLLCLWTFHPTSKTFDTEGFIEKS